MAQQMAGLRDWYFDWVYLPVYDWTVGQLTPYRRLLATALDGLAIEDGQRVISIGVGTGNEASALWRRSAQTRFGLTAIDLSRRGLARVRGKGRRLGREVEVLSMDAQRLGFQDARFDAALCLHTLDFVPDAPRAAAELLRVLKPGGAFVISFPTGKGSAGLGREIFRSVTSQARRGRLLGAAREALAAAGALAVYLPLALAPSPKSSTPAFFATSDVEALLRKAGVQGWRTQEEPAYQDILVWGRR